MTPYGVLGGDRDGDGKFAKLDESISDPYDELTVFQGNYTTNITPQHHQGFNGSGAIWYALERWIQTKLVKKKEVWVIAGCAYNGGEPEVIEKPNGDIHVPPMFFKIVAIKQDDSDTPLVLAFLFPHHRESRKGIDNYLTTIDTIEATTGLDFFSELDDEEEKRLEERGTWKDWATFQAIIDSVETP